MCVVWCVLLISRVLPSLPQARASVTVRCQSEWMEVVYFPLAVLSQVLGTIGRRTCRQRLTAYDALVLHRMDKFYRGLRCTVIQDGVRIPLHGELTGEGDGPRQQGGARPDAGWRLLPPPPRA